MRIVRHGIIFFLLIGALHLVLGANTALAQDAPQPSAWSSEWGTPGWESVAATSVLLGGALAINIGLDSYGEPRWRGPILADRFAHEGLRASTPQKMKVAARISDALVGSLILTPLVAEPALIYFTRDDSSAAGRVALINAQSMALVLFTTSAIKYAVARQRPPRGGCWDDPEFDASCAVREAVSFPSGHSSMAFVGAGLICMNHEVFSPLAGAWDNIACYTALGAAASTGVLRMVAHQHYLSDVLVGAALGLAAGYLLPKVLYFGVADGDGLLAERSGALSPAPAPVPWLSLTTNW